MGYERKVRSTSRGGMLRTSRGGVLRTTKVKPVCIKDVGKVGRGQKVVKLTPKVSLREYGYSMKASQAVRRKALRDASKAYGKQAIKNKLIKLSILFSRRPQLSVINEDIAYLK